MAKAIFTENINVPFLEFVAQGTPSTPATGVGVAYVDSTTKKPAIIDDTGTVFSLRTITNANTTNQVVTTTSEAYLVNSNIAVPPQKVKIGTVFRWRFCITKGADATTAAGVFKLYKGTNGSLSDTAIATFTLPVQTTGVADTAWVEVVVSITSTGAAAASTAALVLSHSLAATGFINVAQSVLNPAVSAFDSTVASLIFGMSCTPGAGATWTFVLVTAECTGV